MEIKEAEYIETHELSTTNYQSRINTEKLRQFMDTERNEKGITLKANKKFYEYLKTARTDDLLKSKNNLKLVKPENDEKAAKVPEQFRYYNYTAPNFPTSNSTYYVTNENANLGYGLASGDLNNDGFDDLVIGAPVYSDLNKYQNGAVFVVLADARSGSVPMRNLNVEKNADIIIRPPSDSVGGRFGHAVVILDLNLDGYNDIVISAPSYDLPNINYEGRVYVYFGNPSNKYDQPQLKITCKGIKYCNVGWTLSTGDVNQDSNDDLLIASPYAATCGDQCGFVSILLSAKKTFDSERDVMSLDWNVKGLMPYEWFGHSVSARLGYLVVGAPQSRICGKPNCEIAQNDTQSVGRAYVYMYPTKTPVTHFTGTTEFEQLGYSCDVSQPHGGQTTIAVASMSKNTRIDNQLSYELNRAGLVQLYQLKKQTDFQFDWIATLKSDRPYSGFGNKVKFFGSKFGLDDDLYVSANLRSDDIFLLDQVQDGIVYRFKGGSSLPRGNITDECPPTDLTPCPGLKARTIFRLSEKISKFGTNFVFLNTANKMRLNAVVASINSSPANYRMSGKANIFSFDLL